MKRLGRVTKRFGDVLGGELREIGEDLFRRHASSDRSNNNGIGNPEPADGGLAVHRVAVSCDSRELHEHCHFAAGACCADLRCPGCQQDYEFTMATRKA